MPKPEGTYPLLSKIQSPADLRQLPAGKLPELAAELREFLIQSVSTRGGHFAAGLGIQWGLVRLAREGEDGCLCGILAPHREDNALGAGRRDHSVLLESHARGSAIPGG